jgi:heparanase 1
MKYGPVNRTEPWGGTCVTVDIADTPRARVDERYLSVAIDSSQLVGGHWWSPSGEVEPGIGQQRVAPFDFANPRLAELARELAPSYLRIGGTEADSIYYAVGETGFRPPPAGYDLVLTGSEWSSLNDFARSAGLDLFFTVNGGPSSRDAEGHWKPDNAESLLRYASGRGDPLAVLELGNEINAYWFAYGLRHQPDGATVAGDLRHLREITRRYYPHALIVGPGEFFWPRVGSPFSSFTRVLSGVLENGGGGSLDALTWHYYPQQSRRCPIATRRASPTLLLEPAFLDEVSRWSGEIESLRDNHAKGLPLWLGETGNAQCGGEPMVSDRFIGSLWWTDELGLLAARGQSVVVRQTLVGSNYGLLDDATLDARPDYFASVLFKRLMGQVVLDVRRQADADPFVRVYAQCTPPRAHKPTGSVTVLAINLHLDAVATVKWPGPVGRDSDIYEITAPDLVAPEALLNGRPMRAVPGQPLSLEPRHEPFQGVVKVAPASYAFAVIDAGAAACN